MHLDHPNPRRRQTKDHVKPLSRGGARAAYNEIYACRGCNEDKDNAEIHDWRDALMWQGDPRAKFVDAFIRHRESEAA